MDFDFDGEEGSMFDFNRAIGSKAEKRNRPAMNRKKRAFGKAFASATDGSVGSRNPSGSQSSKLGSKGSSSSSSTSSSFSSTSSSLRYGTTSIPMKKNGRLNRRRIRRREEENEQQQQQQQQQQQDYNSNDNDDFHDEQDELLSSSSTDWSEPISIVRSKRKTEFSVRRGGGSSVSAFQDAGTYQMVHDECTYLCSTILSRTTLPSKAVDAAMDLATMLSSRKTRSMLWKGEGIDDDDDGSEHKAPSRDNGWNDPQSPLLLEKPKVAPIPKVWSSILEVLALAATASGDSFDTNHFSSNSSISSSTTSSVRAPAASGQPKKKYRTKSARRKEKALLQTGGGGSQASGLAKKLSLAASKGNKLNDNMKDVLACILYFVSWDCTMSGEHSIAAIGAVRSSAVARRIRLAILERGGVLSGIMRLMVPSQPHVEAPAQNTSRKSAFPFNIFPTNSSSTGQPNPPVSPLRPPSVSKRSLRSASSISSIENDEQQTGKSTSSSTTRAEMSTKIVAGDPTAAGRRKRKNRKKISANLVPQQPELLEDCETMPPPSNRNMAQRKVGVGDELSFGNSSDQRKSRGLESTEDGSSKVSDGFTSLITQKIDALCSKIQIESSSELHDLYQQSHLLANNGIAIEGDRPWISIVCLESLCRILTGKELNGKTSCLEGDDANNDQNEEEDSDYENENENVVMVTNRLVGKSGTIPILSVAMSQCMVVATKQIFGSLENGDEERKCTDEEYWIYSYNRLKLLASIVDEACFFSERNRRSFCEDDPFSFQDRKKGLIFHILIFLQHCTNCDLNRLDQKRSETMTLALRTLTSLTHDNPLAAEQMKSHIECDFGQTFDSDSSIQGIQVLANLAFQLEESQPSNSTKRKQAGPKIISRASDHDMHRYDGTIFCLTTLANITEGAGIGRILLEVQLILKSGKKLSWLKWLCQWLVKQTETFRQEILSIGNTKKKKGTDGRENGGISQDEEEKLVAAGNGCVVLACLITESDIDDPESSLYVRNVIKQQMPLNADGSSSGLSLVVNTLKAYCNYYHMSMGQMSVAVVSPVRKLIDELEEIAKVDEDQAS